MQPANSAFAVQLPDMCHLGQSEAQAVYIHSTVLAHMLDKALACISCSAPEQEHYWKMDSRYMHADSPFADVLV